MRYVATNLPLGKDNARKKMKSAPVGVIGKVLSVLELLDSSPGGLQLKDIADRTDINKSTVHRFLSHLESEGYLFRDALGNYMVGPKLAKLGSGDSFQNTLAKIAHPVLENLRNLTGETVNLAVLDGYDLLYIDVLETRHTFRLFTPIGSRLPVYCTSMGKAILANVDDDRREELLGVIQFERITPRTVSNLARLKKQLCAVRERGYAVDDEEAVVGVRCLGAAVIGAEGKVVAAVSISGPVVRITSEQLPIFSRELCKAVREISWLLGNRSSKSTSRSA